MRYLIFLALICQVEAHADVLYETKQTKVGNSQLTSAEQQQLYKIELKKFEDLTTLIDNKLLNEYIDELSAQKKKDRDGVEEELLKTEAVTDREMKEFYDKNKVLIPYPLETVATELRPKLYEEKKNLKRQQVIADIKKKKGFKLHLQEPTKPFFEIVLTKEMPEKGNANSEIVLVEFGDYRCPYCRKAYPLIKDVLASVGKKVKFVYLDYPLQEVGPSKLLAQGAYCANKYGKFWQYHEQAFSTAEPANYDFPLKFAKEQKIDEVKFQECMNSTEAEKYVDASRAQGVKIGLESTPSFYLNGKQISLDNGAKGVIDEIKKL